MDTNLSFTIYAIIIFFGGSGVLYWIGRNIKALRGAVEAQEKTISAQSQMLSNIQGLLSTMRAVLESTDEPKMFKRLEAYKQFVEKEKGAPVSTSIYVGNLPFSATAEDIRDLFSAYGTVESVNLITDRETGQLRGFGFVEMGTDQEASAVIEGLHGTDLDGRSLTVNTARPRADRGGGGRQGGSGRRW